MLKHRKNPVFLLLFLIHTSVFSQIYQTILSNGKIIYSDRLTAGSKPITLKKINYYYTAITPAARKKITIDSQTRIYQELSFAQPRHEQTFQNQHQITVSFNIKPSLQKVDKIALSLDGQPPQAIADNKILLNNLDRGQHNLQAKIMDSTGKTLIESNTITFYVHYS